MLALPHEEAARLIFTNYFLQIFYHHCAQMIHVGLCAIKMNLEACAANDECSLKMHASDESLFIYAVRHQISFENDEISKKNGY